MEEPDPETEPGPVVEPGPVEIPFSALSADALRGVVESFVLREGTEYGEREFSLEEKITQVMAQLARGDARILFDPESETVTLVPKEARPDKLPRVPP